MSRVIAVNGTSLGTTLALHAKAAPYKAGLLGVLTLVLVVVLVRQLSGGPQSVEAAPPLRGTVALTAAEAVPVAAHGRTPTRPPLPDLPDAPVRDIFESGWLPTNRLMCSSNVGRDNESGRPLAVAPPLVLELTFTENTDEGRHCAVISGRRVRLKDMIDGYVVESITPGLVILVGREGERIMLHMN